MKWQRMIWENKKILLLLLGSFTIFISSTSFCAPDEKCLEFIQPSTIPRHQKISISLFLFFEKKNVLQLMQKSESSTSRLDEEWIQIYFWMDNKAWIWA
jgi:hypothetical protein